MRNGCVLPMSCPMARERRAALSRRMDSAARSNGIASASRTVLMPGLPLRLVKDGLGADLVRPGALDRCPGRLEGRLRDAHFPAKFRVVQSRKELAFLDPVVLVHEEFHNAPLNLRADRGLVSCFKRARAHDLGDDFTDRDLLDRHRDRHEFHPVDHRSKRYDENRPRKDLAEHALHSGVHLAARLCSTARKRSCLKKQSPSPHNTGYVVFHLELEEVVLIPSTPHERRTMR